MRLLACLHPKKVYNKYSGEFVTARCGKCPACLNARAANWVQRLDIEMAAHRYTYFCTFQYDELHVQQLVRLSNSDAPFNGDIAYINPETYEIISLYDDCITSFKPKDKEYCLNTKVLNVIDVSDFQKFIKILRQQIKRIDKNAKLRYFNTFEYGPTTFRPHSHCLFFFDSPLLAKDFAELLVRNWKYGCAFDPHPVFGSAAQYVASYVNSFISLPAIYLHKSIRPRSNFSKCPPIGLTEWTSETFIKLFNSQTLRLTLFQKSSSSFIDVPFWRCVQSRLYPKLPRFNSLSHADRVILYRLSERRKENESSRDFAERLIYTFFSQPNRWSYYFDDVFKTDAILTDPTDKTRYHERVYNERSMLRFVRTLKLFQDLVINTKLTPHVIVKRIEEYYENLQKSDLREYYKLQDEYFSEHPASDFLLLNTTFCDDVSGKKFSSLKDWQKLYLSEYGYFFEDDEIVELDYTKVEPYKELKALHEKVYFDNTKTKKQNDYLLANKDKFGNIINYFNE